MNHNLKEASLANLAQHFCTGMEMLEDADASLSHLIGRYNERGYPEYFVRVNAQNKDRKEVFQNPYVVICEEERDALMVLLCSSLDFRLQYGELVEEWVDYGREHDERYRAPLTRLQELELEMEELRDQIYTLDCESAAGVLVGEVLDWDVDSYPAIPVEKEIARTEAKTVWDKKRSYISTDPERNGNRDRLMLTYMKDRWTILSDDGLELYTGSSVEDVSWKLMRKTRVVFVPEKAWEKIGN